MNLPVPVTRSFIYDTMLMGSVSRYAYFDELCKCVADYEARR
jgi:hypothetical protein